MDNVTTAFQRMHNQRRINIAKSFGVSISDDIQKGEDTIELSSKKQEIIKSLSSDNPFEVEYGKELLEKSDLSDIEKSDIMEAISYGNGNQTSFGIKKTGKEIKEQIKNVLLPSKQAELATKKAEADKLLSECGNAPTKDIRPWFTDGIKMDVGYKIYDWEECRLKCKDETCVYNNVDWEGEKPQCNCPETEEQCKARNDYNQAVEIICRILVDIKACEILTKNLTDGQNITLTPRQVLAFQFD